MKFLIVLVFVAVVAGQAQDNNTYEAVDNKLDPEQKVKTKPIVGVEPTIIGGTTVTQGQFPWMVAIIIDFSKFCAGTLITNAYIMTAAHCQIAPVRLPYLSQENTDFAGSQATATGWGKINDTSNTMSPTMNAVNLQVVTNTECKKYFSSKYIISSTLCAYGSGTKAICSGDSGGPLHVTESDGKYTQIAIASFTSSYSCLTYPNGFARVMAFKSWIISTTNNTYTFRP